MKRASSLLLLAFLCVVSHTVAVKTFVNWLQIVDKANADKVRQAFGLVYRGGIAAQIMGIFEGQYKSVKISSDCKVISFSGPHGKMQQNRVVFVAADVITSANAILNAKESNMLLSTWDLSITLVDGVCRTNGVSFSLLKPIWRNFVPATEVDVTPNDCGVTCEFVMGVRKTTPAKVKKSAPLTGYAQEIVGDDENQLAIHMEFRDAVVANQFSVVSKSADLNNRTFSFSIDTVASTLWPDMAKQNEIKTLVLPRANAKAAAEAFDKLEKAAAGSAYEFECKNGFNSYASAETGSGLKIIKITHMKFGAPYHYAGIIHATPAFAVSAECAGADQVYDYLTFENWASGSSEVSNDKWFMGLFQYGRSGSAEVPQSFHAAHIASFFDASAGSKNDWNSAVTWGLKRVDTAVAAPGSLVQVAVVAADTNTPHASHATAKATGKAALFSSILGGFALRKTTTAEVSVKDPSPELFVAVPSSVSAPKTPDSTPHFVQRHHIRTLEKKLRSDLRRLDALLQA